MTAMAVDVIEKTVPAKEAGVSCNAIGNMVKLMTLQRKLGGYGRNKPTDELGNGIVIDRGSATLPGNVASNRFAKRLTKK